MTARFGFKDDPDLPAALRLAALAGAECDVDADGASWFLSRITIAPGADPDMPMWQEKLFVVLARTAASPAEFFSLPDDRTVVMSSRVCV